MSDKTYVWYASYGSNVSRDRFLCYLQGGQPVGSTKNYPGCRDTSLPRAELPIIFNHDLYFAKSSGTWQNGGVGFVEIQPNAGSLTYGKKYLITTEQFCDVVRQEVDSDVEIHIDFNNAVLNGNSIFRGGWYGNLLFLRHDSGHPVFTFTNEVNLTPINRPSENYLLMISIGIIETHRINQGDLINYLLSKRGIVGNYSREKLLALTNQLF